MPSITFDAGAGGEHGAGDREKAIGDRSQRAGVTVTTSAQVDYARIHWLQPTEAARVGAQRVGEHLGAALSS